MRLWCCCLLVFLLGCEQKSAQRNFFETYIHQAVDSIQVHSIYRERINPDSLAHAMIADLEDNFTIDSVYLLVQSAIQSIDNHSYVLSKTAMQKLEEGHEDFVPQPFPFQGKIIEGRYAFLSLEGFAGLDSVSADKYTDSLQHLLVNLYEQDPDGWIIDLRDNTGGWFYAMIAGLGPVLGEGIKAYEITADGNVTPFYYIKHDSLSGKKDRILLADSAFVFQKQLPTAVLIGPKTGSAGELLALSFKGNPKTVLIGQPTYGASTGIRGLMMMDSSQLCLAQSLMTDRYKNTSNTRKIEPTLTVEDPLQLFYSAYDWIDKHRERKAY